MRDKVVILGSFAPSLINFRGDLIRQLSANGYQLVLCAPNIKEHSELVAEGIRLGATMYSAPLARKSRNPLSDVIYLLFLSYIFLREKPNVVFSYTIKPAVYGSVAAYLTGVGKRIALITGLGETFTEDGSQRNGLLSRVANSVIRVGLSAASTVILQNADDKQMLIDREIAQESMDIRLIQGSGVNMRHFRRSALDPKNRIVLMVARFHTTKGIREYMKSATIVRERLRDVRFILVGFEDGGRHALSYGQVKGLANPGGVEVITSCKDVRPYIENCGVFALPSYREGLPRTVLEAMSMGRPVVTTDVPGCRSAIEHMKTGIIVQPRCSESLAEGIIQLLDNPALAKELSDNAWVHCSTHFSIDVINKQYMDAMR